MPLYHWQGIDAEGITHQGSLYASSTEELQDILSKKQLGLIQAKILRTPSLTRMQKDAFFSHLAALLSAHIPLYEALCIMRSTHSSSGFAVLLDDMARNIAQGDSLTQVLDQHRVLDPLSRALIGVGEATGTLGPLLQHVVTYRAQAALSIGRIKQALRMPLITLSFFGVIVLGMLLFAVPQFVGFFEAYQVPLPIITSWLIVLSVALTRKTLLLVLVGMLMFVGCMRGVLATVRGKACMDLLIDSVPVIGSLRVTFIRARILKVLGILVAQQVPLSKALEACEALTFHQASQSALNALRRSVDQGQDFSKAWHESSLNDSESEMLLALGEASGKLSMLMLYASESLEKRAHERLEVIILFLNPLLLISISVLVGCFMYGMYMPLITLSSAF